MEYDISLGKNDIHIYCSISPAILNSKKKLYAVIFLCNNGERDLLLHVHFQSTYSKAE